MSGKAGDRKPVTKVDNPEVRGAFLQVWNDNGNDPTQGESVFADWLAGVRNNASYDKVQRNETAITYLKHCATLRTEPDKHRLMAILTGEGES